MNRLRIIRLWVLGLLLLAVPAASFAGVFVNITIAPPLLPVYVQPPCPGDGFIWTPGYWAYGLDGYYWVPGTWVLAPAPGLLWTPGYWGWGGGFYVWHAGYWGPHIGFYGGVNYGFGYFGTGYAGGYWNSGRFFYNRSVNNITITNVNVYNRTVINTTVINRVSYNGGTGGINARPTREEEGFARERHSGATDLQIQHERTAGNDRQMLASVNRGRPAMTATERPSEFNNRGNAGPRGMNANENRTVVPRPGNSARPETTPRNVGMDHNNVPRPPASASNNGFRADRTSRPAPRPESTPRAQNTYRPQNDMRMENRGRTQNEPRAQAPRPQNEFRPQSMPRQQTEPRAQAMPRPQNEPRLQAHNTPAPRPTPERGGRQGGGFRAR